MRKMRRVLPGLLFVAVFLISGKVLAAENMSAAEESVEELKTAEAGLANLPDGSVPLDEEIQDEEVIDTDA